MYKRNVVVRETCKPLGTSLIIGIELGPWLSWLKIDERDPVSNLQSAVCRTKCANKMCSPSKLATHCGVKQHVRTKCGRPRRLQTIWLKHDHRDQVGSVGSSWFSWLKIGQRDPVGSCGSNWFSWLKLDQMDQLGFFDSLISLQWKRQ